MWLSDLVLINIDLIDCNLYECLCDCCWWVIDVVMVNVLENLEDEVMVVYVFEWFGVILKVYIVYFDIVLVNFDGMIIVNGCLVEYVFVGLK